MPRSSRKQRAGHSCFYAVFSHRFTICRVDMSISFSPHIKKAVCPIMENEIIKSCLCKERQDFTLRIKFLSNIKYDQERFLHYKIYSQILFSGQRTSNKVL